MRKVYRRMVGKDMGRKWYAEGLYFTCQQCGRCCTGEPGYVWVSRAELRLIAKFLKISEARVREQHCRRIGLRLSLTELANGDCTFLEDAAGDRGCKIYSVRPLQCRTWPFWDLNLGKPNAWNLAGRRCRGMNKGEFHSLEDIEEQLKRKKWW